VLELRILTRLMSTVWNYYTVGLTDEALMRILLVSRKYRLKADVKREDWVLVLTFPSTPASTYG
jgi:hypothetical protein